MKHWLLIVGLAVVVLVVGCDSGPTCPKPHASQYFFYGMNNLTPVLLRLDLTTCTVDSIGDSTLYLAGHALSADGRNLVVSLGDSLVVYSIAKRRVEQAVHVRAFDASCSRDGRLMAVVGGEGYGLSILNLPGYNTWYLIDTLKLGHGEFSRDGKTLYCLDGTPSLRQVVRIRIIPMLSIEAIPTPTMPGALIQVVPSVDEKLLFLYSTWSWDGCSFGVWDVAQDSLIYLSNFRPGFGGIAVSPDGRNVFFTNGGTLHFGTPPPSAFYRYDIAANTVEEISTRGWGNDTTGNGDFLPIGPLAITPDGRTLVGVRAVIGNDLIVYDVRRGQISDYCNFDYKVLFYDIFCQAGK